MQKKQEKFFKFEIYAKKVKHNISKKYAKKDRGCIF